VAQEPAEWTGQSKGAVNADCPETRCMNADAGEIEEVGDLWSRDTSANTDLSRREPELALARSGGPKPWRRSPGERL
jgi:hypothetical protein